MNHLDTASIAAGRIKAAFLRSEERRERRRKNEIEPTPIEAVASTIANPCATDRTEQQPPGEIPPSK